MGAGGVREGQGEGAGMGRKRNKEHSVGGKPSEGLLRIGCPSDNVGVVPGSGSIQRWEGKDALNSTGGFLREGWEV